MTETLSSPWRVAGLVFVYGHRKQRNAMRRWSEKTPPASDIARTCPVEDRFRCTCTAALSNGHLSGGLLLCMLTQLRGSTRSDSPAARHPCSRDSTLLYLPRMPRPTSQHRVADIVPCGSSSPVRLRIYCRRPVSLLTKLTGARQVLRS